MSTVANEGAAGEVRPVPADVVELLRTHLAGQFERANVILFTGAGFSSQAKNAAGRPVPTAQELRDQLWGLCFPGQPVDETSSLPYLYEHALVRHMPALAELLRTELSVAADSLPTWYEQAFSLPWFRCYTLNVDDLELASARRFALPRRVVAISATAAVPQREAHGSLNSELEVVHLNGTLDDAPADTTFSPTQYAERLAANDVWYSRLASDLVTRPFVFVGTRLDEPPLWQHIELRAQRGATRGLREMRPRSYLVTPHLDQARLALLAEFNVVWVPLSAHEFVSFVARELAAQRTTGLELIARVAGPRGTRPAQLPEVDQLAANADQRTDFLLGQEPVWADIVSGRAVPRGVDERIHGAVEVLRAAQGGLVSVAGTAGSGKSAALMREALRQSAAGRRVAWIERESEFTPREIRERMSSSEGPDILAIDDGEAFGAELASIVRELALTNRPLVVIAAVRAGRADQVLNPARLGATPHTEIGMPPLEDGDIDNLLDALDRDNRLGVLRGMNREQQRLAFREQAGRQLLVALYQATSGRRFEEKVVEEFEELEPSQKVAYSLVVVASALGYSLSPDEVLLASGDRTNTTLNVLDRLVARHIVVPAGDGTRLRARHRVVASLLLDELRRRGQLADVMQGLALVAATKVSRGLPRSARAWRFLRGVISHDFLMKTVGVEVARNIYGGIEGSLAWDYHYWLQRGSLEVEIGNVALAENFLAQARALSAGDPFVDNEWAYLLFKKALADPRGVDAESLANQARALLEDLVRTRGELDSYPYHVMGSQGLAWARRGILSTERRHEFLRSLVAVLEEGVRRHPRVAELETLAADVKREYLSDAVRDDE